MKKKNNFIAVILTLSIIFSNFSYLSSTILAETPIPQPEGKSSPYIVSEMESMRTQTEKYFLMSDGSYTVASYATPVHYQDASGVWHEIDNSLFVQDEKIVTKDAPVDTVLTERLTENGTVSLQAGEHEIRWGYLDAEQSVAEIDTQQQAPNEGDEAFLMQENLLSRVRYADAFSHVDLQYIISSLGVKDNIILKSRQAQNVYQVRYQYDGLSAVLSDSRLIELKDADNQTVYRITAPVMTDADGNSSEALCFKLLKNTSTELIFELSADTAWLQTATYPVVIDPSTELVPDAELVTTATINETNDYMNTGILSGVYTTSLGEEENIGVLKVNAVPSINTWNYIKEATLYLSFSSFGGSISAYHVDYDGDLQDLTWQTLSEKMEFDPMDYYIDKPWYTGTADLDVTRSLQNFVNNGIGVIAIKSDNGSLFTANVGSDMPKITVNYGVQTGISSLYSYTTFDAGRAGVAYVNDLTGQLFIRREDFSYPADTISASVGMNFAYKADGLHWRNQYAQTITRSGTAGAYTYVLDKSDGTSLSFVTAREDDDGNTYYTDTEKQGYTYYPEENKIERDTGDVYLYSGSGDTKYLSKITNQSYETENGYSSAVEIAYNADYSRIETVTDGDGKIYKYNYDALSILTSVDYYGENGLSGDVIDSVSYTYYYGTGDLTTVKYHNETSTYQYNQQTRRFEGMSAPDGYGFEFEIDFVRNKVKSVTEYGGSVQGDQITMTREPGRTIYTDLSDQQKIFVFDQSGKPVTIMDEKGYTVHQKYAEDGARAGTTDVSVPVTNLITNNSFEDGLNTFGTFGTVAQSNENVYNGKYAAKLTHTADREGDPTKVRHALTGMAAGTYTFSAYVLAAAMPSDGYAALRVFYFDENNNESDPIYSEKITAVSEVWERLVVTITLPEGANALIMEAIVGGTAGTVYYDALQLEKHKTAYAYNPVSNSDFQKGETDWILTDNAEIVTDNAVRGGLDGHVLRIQGTGLDSEEQAKQIVLLNQQQITQITFAVWLKTQGAMKDGAAVWGNSAAARICFYFGTLSDSGDLAVQESHLYEVNPFVCGNWYRVSDAFAVDGVYDAVMISVEFREQSGTLYADGFEIGTTDFGGDVSMTEEAETQTESGSTGSEETQPDSSEQNEDVVYDDEGRVLSVTQGDVTRSYAYNDDDQTTMEKLTVDNMSLTSHYAYASSDGQNSVTQTDPLGHSSTTVKDAIFDQVVRKVYQDGTEAGYAYNALRQLANLENENADKSSGTHVTYVYEHERISQIMLSENHLTYTFDYNPFGGVTSISVEDQPLVTYTYVSNVRRVPSCITFGNGQTLNYTYTDDWQVQTVYLGQQKIMEYEYAETGKQLCEKDCLNGRLRTVDEKGTRVWNLDKTQLLYTCTDIGEELNETVGTLAYQTIKKELEDEKSVSFGNLTKITAYDAFERISTVTVKNGEQVLFTQTYSYISPSSGETSKLVASVTTTAGNNSSVTEYTYNEINNITSVSVDNVLTTTYTYTNNDQLATETDYLNNKRYCYSYDKYGNITQKKEQDITITDGKVTVNDEQTTNYTYDGEWQDQLASVGGKTITYDGSGNMTSYDGATYNWSAGRRLVSFAKGNTNAFYLYDINGLRTSKTVGQTVYTYTWLEDMPVHLQKGNTNMHFYYDSDGKVTGMSYNGTDYFYDRNLMGDVVRILTSTGQPVVTYQYDAWGNILSKSGSMADTLGTDNPFRYRGYMYDEESGLYYLQSRYYDPRLGRYISPDNTEVLFGQTNLTTMYNLYAYCCNNPIAAIDPNGYWTIHGVYAVSNSKYDTLVGLALQITGRAADATALRKEYYGNTIRIGEKVNIENLLLYKYVRAINSRCSSKNGNAYSVVFDGATLRFYFNLCFHYRSDGKLDTGGLTKFQQVDNTNRKFNTYAMIIDVIDGIKEWQRFLEDRKKGDSAVRTYEGVLGQYPMRVFMGIGFIIKKHVSSEIDENNLAALNEPGYINIYMMKVKNTEKGKDSYTTYGSNDYAAIGKTYTMVLYYKEGDTSSIQILARHEIGHAIGLADGYEHGTKEPYDVDQYGLPIPHVMAGQLGLVYPQHISMVIYALYENKVQFFHSNLASDRYSNDPSIYYHTVSPALTIYHTNIYPRVHAYFY